MREFALRQFWTLALTMLIGGSVYAAKGPSAGTIRRVVEIRYVGISALTPRDLAAALPFASGDKWNDGIPKDTEEALTRYYANRGFFSARVSAYPEDPKTMAVTLVIQVEEGPPCQIKSISLNDPPGFTSKHVLNRFRDKMLSVLQTKQGDRYDEEVLGDRLRELKEWLVAENFILASTENVKLTFNQNKTFIDLALEVEYGDRVTFGFQGNSIFTKGELNEFIAQVRATGLGKDYVGVIQRRFVDEYKARAYNQIKIDARTSENSYSKHVTFLFKEGLRTELEGVRWEGLIGANVEAAKEAFDKGTSRLVQRGYFIEKDIDKGILIVLEDLKARGFLSSKLIAKTVQPVKNPKNIPRVRVLIQVAEGEQTLVGKIRIEGFSHFSFEQILSTLEIQEERPFNPFSLEEGLQRLNALYIGEGFLDFRILTHDDHIVHFTENNRLAEINLRLQEGTRVKIGSIQIRGLQKTHEYIVARELSVKSDDWWLASDIQETEANIRKLGLFSEVKVSAEPSERGPGFRDMLISLKEAEPGALELGPGFRSDLGLRGFARVSYNNIFGRNWIGALSAEGNRRIDDQYRFVEYKFDANFIEPRFFGTRNLYTVGVSTKKQRFPPDFNAATTTLMTGFERKITKMITTKLVYKLERIRQFDVIVQGQQFPDDNRSMLIGSVVPSIVVDTRDSPFLTTSGWLFTGSLEYAQPQFSGQKVSESGAHAYQKWTGSVHRYTSITKDILWSNVVAAGFERSNVAGREIPLIKRFRLGGYSTLRGFPEDSINVDERKLVGTLTFLNLRTQIDLPLVGDLKIAPFLDAGNLYLDTFEKRPFFRASSGVGLHYLTPVGPINLDWGFKLNPQGGDNPSQIHFSVGLI
ncbi:MAG: POTRA domain-containing protein [Bdellovibrionota bacterium]